MHVSALHGLCVDCVGRLALLLMCMVTLSLRRFRDTRLLAGLDFRSSGTDCFRSSGTDHGQARDRVRLEEVLCSHAYEPCVSTCTCSLPLVGRCLDTSVPRGHGALGAARLSVAGWLGLDGRLRRKFWLRSEVLSCTWDWRGSVCGLWSGLGSSHGGLWSGSTRVQKVGSVSRWLRRGRGSGG